jgi:hypothetical protein
MLHITGLNRKLSAKSECNFSQNGVWVNSHLLVDSFISSISCSNYMDSGESGGVSTKRCEGSSMGEQGT